MNFPSLTLEDARSVFGEPWVLTLYLYIYTCICVYMCIYIYTLICVYMYTHIYIYIYTFVYVYMSIYIYIHSIQLCVCVYIYIFQYTHLMNDTSNIPSVSKEVVFFCTFFLEVAANQHIHFALHPVLYYWSALFVYMFGTEFRSFFRDFLCVL